MKTKTKLIALIGVAALGAYAANKIKRTQDLKPEVSVELPESKTIYPKTSVKNSLPKALLNSYKSQITEMTKTMDPNKDLLLVHYVSSDDKQARYLDELMGAQGYEKESGTSRTLYRKNVKANAQTIFDEVVFTAQTAKSLKQDYLGWDFGK